MALDGCGLLCKGILIIFNIIFAVLGFACFGLGLWLRLSPNTRLFFEIETLSASAFVMAVTVLIVIGSVMLIVIVFGEYGACNEKRWALQVFSILLAILTLAVITVGVITYINKEMVELSMVELYNNLYALYSISGDPVIAATLTFIHKMLDCCGMTGIALIELVSSTCPDGFFMHTCAGVIADVFDSKAPLVMGIFIGTGCLLITATICSTILLQKVKRVQQEITAYYSNVY